MRTSTLFTLIVVTLLAATLNAGGPMPPAYAYSLSLTAKDIQEAMEYGASHAMGHSLKLPPNAPWRREIPNEEVDVPHLVVWQTPFLYLAGMRAAQGRNLSAQEIDAILRATRERVTVTVVTSTRERVEPKVLTVLVVRADGSLVHPDAVDAQDVGWNAEKRVYHTNVHAGFLYRDGLSPSEIVTVVVGWGARSFSVAFDLAALR